jgi:outer membrane immunogenic protein
MRRLLVAPLLAAVLLNSVGQTFAADMAIPPVYTPPASAPIIYSPPPYSWTGFYVGGNAGWGWTQFSETITTGAGAGSVSGSGRGFLGGGQAGFNWQVFDPIVFGVEADLQGTTQRGTLRGTVGPALITGDPREPYFGTIRGRIGFAYDRLLVYATAGGVLGDNLLNGTSSTTGAFSSSSTYTSWTVGGGIEAALGGHFSAKLEYLYIGSPSSLPLPTGATAVTGTANTNIVRVGVNYRF